MGATFKLGFIFFMATVNNRQSPLYVAIPLSKVPLVQGENGISQWLISDLPHISSFLPYLLIIK